MSVAIRVVAMRDGVRRATDVHRPDGAGAFPVIMERTLPKFDVNPNTGEPEGKSRCRRVAMNTVFVDADRPGRVVLPLLPV